VSVIYLEFNISNTAIRKSAHVRVVFLHRPIQIRPLLWLPRFLARKLMLRTRHTGQRTKQQFRWLL